MMQVTSEFALRALNNPRDPWERGVTSYGFFSFFTRVFVYPVQFDPRWQILRKIPRLIFWPESKTILPN